MIWKNLYESSHYFTTQKRTHFIVLEVGCQEHVEDAFMCHQVNAKQSLQDTQHIEDSEEEK